MKEPERPGERSKPRVKKLVHGYNQGGGSGGKAQKLSQTVRASNPPARWKI